MSGNNFTRFLAFNPLIKTAGNNIPFATDIDFITNRFWFKLNKGLTNSRSLPKSMDVIAKAQVVLSSHINSSVSEKFDLMKKEYSIGKISKEDAEYLHHELRSKTSTPEDISQDTLEDALAFLTANGFEKHLREKTILERKVAEGDEAIKEIEAINLAKINAKKRRDDIKKRRKSNLITIVIILLMVSFYGIFGFFVYSFKQGEDSFLTIFGIVFSFIIGTYPLFKFNAIRNKIVKAIT